MCPARQHNTQGGRLDINAAAAGVMPKVRNTLGTLPELREQWIDKISDLVGGVPPKLPPWRLINHQINLIDHDKWINYHLLKCPDALKEELAEKISQYTSAGWWVPVTVRQAVPMLCVLKKNGKLRTVFDLLCRMRTRRRMSLPFRIKTLYSMTLRMPRTGPNWTCLKRTSRYVYATRTSQRQPSLPYSAHS